jgi:hypothetical protein
MMLRSQRIAGLGYTACLLASTIMNTKKNLQAQKVSHYSSQGIISLIILVGNSQLPNNQANMPSMFHNS